MTLLLMLLHLSEISTVEKKSNGIHIPLDLTLAILSRLPVKSLVRFQCVSKLWSSLIIDSIVVRCSTQPCLGCTNLRSSRPLTTKSLLLAHSCPQPKTYLVGLGILLPEINYDKYCNMGSDGFVGYDSVEDQVFTLLGGPKKQQLRSLDIQGTWNLSLEATFIGLSIHAWDYLLQRKNRCTKE
ncbi:hypothetical protein YC2023_040613 [Brassica napus]